MPLQSCYVLVIYIYISLSHESTHSWGFPVAPFMKPRFWCFFPMNLATVSESWPYWEAFVISTSQHPCHSSYHFRKTHMRKAAYMSVYSELPSQNVVYGEQSSHSGLKYWTSLKYLGRDFDTGRDRARLCSPMLSSAGPLQRAFRWAQSANLIRNHLHCLRKFACVYNLYMGIDLKVLERIIIAMTVQKLILEFAKLTCYGRSFTKVG